MDFQINIFLLCFSLLTHIVHGNVARVDSETDWSHKLNLEQKHGIKFQWKNTEQDKDGQRWIILEATAKAKGYIGVGFSPHGGMAGADMAISWINSDGKEEIRDFYGIENGSPIEDSKNDYELLHLSSRQDSMTVRFKRRWDTCDDQDFAITNDTMRLIWAYSDSKPVIRNGMFSARYHGPTSRGTKSVIIAEGGIAAPFPDDKPYLYPGVKTFDMQVDNVTIDFKDTYYHCQTFKFTDLSRKHHMIGWKPILEKGNEDIVHHMLLFECSVPEEDVPTFDRFVETKRGGTCYTPNMPAEWGRNCVGFSLVWVVGSEGEMLPEHVGAPMGEIHGGATYFMIETHYENPSHRITKDSSGIRMFYSEKLRENDGGALLFGYRHSPFLLIPPNQDNFLINGVCGTECTSTVIPPTGIKVVTTMGHMHLTGKKTRLRHFRDGVELPTILEDNHYDFDYQQSRTLKHEITIYPGDELLAECEYSTANVDRYVIGGLATHQEMCQLFLFYYPRIQLSQCTSQYEFHDFFKGLGIDGVEGKVLKALNMPYEPHLLPKEDQEKDMGDDARELEGIEAGISFKSVFNHMNITGPPSLRGKSVGPYLEEVKWTKENGKALEEFWKRGKNYQFCSRQGLKRVVLKNHKVDYPEIKEPLYRGPSEVCRREQLLQSSNSCTISPANGIFILLVFISLANIWRN